LSEICTHVSDISSHSSIHFTPMDQMRSQLSAWMDLGSQTAVS